MAEKKIGKGSLIAIIILSAVGIFMGLAFLEAIADQQALITESASITDENTSVLTLFAAPYNCSAVNLTAEITLVHGNWTSAGVTAVSYSNGSDLLETTDWVENNTGEYITFKDTTAVQLLCNTSNNRSLIDYGYWRDEAVNVGATSKTMISMIVLLFAIGIILFVISKSRESLESSGITT